MRHAKKPCLVKGTRDFDAWEVAKRDYLFEKIRSVYRQYGFTPLETPALEYLDTLLGHYGQEGDRLLFKIINSGNFLSDVPKDCTEDYKKLSNYIAEKGLRYDLTVPLMRYIATHYQELSLPYRRYQIQPVWRADRPQHGRYREFYQCDADVIGSQSILCEAELLAMAQEIFQRFGIKEFIILVNHRLILNGLASLMGEVDRVSELFTSLDKLDKVGKDNVLAELKTKGFSTADLAKIDFIFNKHDTKNWLERLEEEFQSHEKGLAGVLALRQLLEQLGHLKVTIQIDPTLARGLAYYTGIIFELKIPSLSIGSIGSGGRYDNFADQFGVKGLTGVGLSLGIERLYLALEALHLLPEPTRLGTYVMFTNLYKEAENMVLGIVMACRQQDIPTEIYPEQLALKKQLAYANKKGIPFVVIIDENEKSFNKWLLKDMQTGNQAYFTTEELLRRLTQEGVSTRD